MAHELDRNDANGQAAMFSVKETPWHQQGVLLREAPSLDEAIVLAGHDFEVGLRPIQTVGGKAIDTHFATVREDRDVILGVVGRKYKPLQNRDAFAIIEPLLDAGLAKLETGGTLRGGRDVWMMIRFEIDSPAVREVFADEVVPFGLICNNHAGSRRAIIRETPIRVVCANTLGFALAEKSERSVAARHTENVQVALTNGALKLWSGLVERYEGCARAYGQLKAKQLSQKQFDKAVLDLLAPLPKAPATPEEKGKMYDATVARQEAKRARLTELWTKGDGHVGDGSAWEAYNGAVQSLDHDVDIWKAGKQGMTRAESMLDGTIAWQKGRVLTSLMKVGAKK